jgi:hypothetical protein
MRHFCQSSNDKNRANAINNATAPTREFNGLLCCGKVTTEKFQVLPHALEAIENDYLLLASHFI